VELVGTRTLLAASHKAEGLPPAIRRKASSHLLSGIVLSSKTVKLLRRPTERPLSPMCGRLSVGKLEQWLCIAGWCGHVSDLLVRRMVPLAVMPFARFGSRSIARTRGAWAFWVLPIRRFQPACCISSCSPFPTSSGAVARAVFLTRPAARGSARRWPSSPRSCGRSCWRARQRRPWPGGGRAVARAMVAWPRSAQRTEPRPSHRR